MIVPEKFIREIIAPACNYEKRICEAFVKVPRHKFVDEALITLSYNDDALPIGYGQTISKPSTVAYMTYLLDPQKSDRVLEIGTGSGYQAAILSKLVNEVYTVERISALYSKASKTIRSMFINNVRFKVDNGVIGWQEHSPYDKIIVTAEADILPEDLLFQLKEGGLMVIPLKGELKLLKKKKDSFTELSVGECKFVKFVF